MVSYLPLMVPSSSRYALDCCSMVSEKSAATTPLNCPLLANLRVNRPLPQLMSITTSLYAGVRYYGQQGHLGVKVAISMRGQGIVLVRFNCE